MNNTIKIVRPNLNDDGYTVYDYEKTTNDHFGKKTDKVSQQRTDDEDDDDDDDDGLVSITYAANTADFANEAIADKSTDNVENNEADNDNGEKNQKNKISRPEPELVPDLEIKQNIPKV